MLNFYVLHLVLQKSDAPFFQQCKSRVLRMKQKGQEAKKSMKLATASQLAKCSAGLYSAGRHSLFTRETFSGRIIQRNHTSENTERKKRGRMHTSFSSISHFSLVKDHSMEWNSLNCWVVSCFHLATTQEAIYSPSSTEWHFI